MPGLRAFWPAFSSWLASGRLTKPIDPTGALAKALEAYPATAIDDSDEDEPMPIEEAAEPTNGGLSQARIKLIQLNPALFIFEETREETR
jgi:hypothetical protein